MNKNQAWNQQINLISLPTKSLISMMQINFHPKAKFYLHQGMAKSPWHSLPILSSTTSKFSFIFLALFMNFLLEQFSRDGQKSPSFMTDRTGAQGRNTEFYMPTKKQHYYEFNKMTLCIFWFLQFFKWKGPFVFFHVQK